MEYFDYHGVETSSWTYKHRPKTIPEIIGNKKAIYSITKWLQGFNANKKTVLDRKKQELTGKKKKTTGDFRIQIETNCRGGCFKKKCSANL